MGGTDLANKCLDFCQTLSSRGSAFKFSLTMGSNFSFSLDTNVLTSDIQVKYVPKKKPSPSTIRRNARRREMFLSKKRNPAPPSTARPLQYPPEVPTPEKERLPDEKGRVEVASQPSPPSSPSEPEGASSPSGQKSEESPMSSPPPTVSLKCDLHTLPDGQVCRKTFNCEEDFRNHNHGVRNVCIMRSRHGAAFSRSFRKDCICD